jgi:hypothetical protein
VYIGECTIVIMLRAGRLKKLVVPAKSFVSPGVQSHPNSYSAFLASEERAFSLKTADE